MSVVRQFWRDGRMVLPIRFFHAASAILTISLACPLACAIVWALANVVGSSLSLTALLGICSLLTMFVSGFLLAWETRYYLRPAEEVAKAAAKIAAGDFQARIPPYSLRIMTVEGCSLMESFNRMAQELCSLDEMRKDFIGNVSHEFKTPLSSIVGFTEILKDGGLSEEERQEYTSLVHEEALRLSRLAEKLLRLSRLDSQSIVTKKEIFAADEQIRKCLILFTERLAEKEQTLDIDLPVMEMESDPDLTSQIWLNLIDNALKYSAKGKTLHVSGAALEHEIRVSIRDEGSGIAKEKQEHIFERFYQCEESHKEQGNGLGLSIVKRIVELLQGTIECHSEEGHGTEMIVTLPRKKL